MSEMLKISLDIFGIVFCYYACAKSSNIIFGSKIKILGIKETFGTLTIIIFAYYNVFYNYSFLKIVVSFLCLFIFFKIIFKEDNKVTLLKFLIIYSLSWVIETLFGTIFVAIFIKNLKQLDSMFIKFPLSLLIMLVLLLLSYIKSVKKLLNKLYNSMLDIINLTLVLFFFIIVLVVLTFYLMIAYSVVSYISISVLIFIFILVFYMTIKQVFSVKKADEKQEILLNFMKKYETIIDNERISRHEMLNNLLVLKSIKNKNSKEYDNILNEIIDSYKTDKTYSRLYDLPSGLKGIFYYKIYDMQSKGIEPYVDISNKVIKNLECLNLKKLSRLSKILGILLDNAKEAAEITKDKIVIIDVYEDNNGIIIYIENSISRDLQNLNLKDIKEKGFSTKGYKRGYGLYLVQTVLKKSESISLNQKIENKRFVSIIKIK